MIEPVTAKTTDWNPGTYHRFRGQRLRPALDLIAALPGLPAGDVVDLGCGSGAAAADLKLRFPVRRLVGIDASAAMLADAQSLALYDRLDQTDIGPWTATAPVALIYANAALHWVADHATLLPRLTAMLAPGGTLAVQMPHQNNAPSHRVWVSLMAEHFPGRYDPASGPGILPAVEYHRLLSPLGNLFLWETEYFQVLDACDDGAHPVRRFTEATFARPILSALDAAEQTRLIAAYEAVMDHAYPRAPDGSVLFPFRRLFFTVTV